MLYFILISFYIKNDMDNILFLKNQHRFIKNDMDNILFLKNQHRFIKNNI